MATFYKTKNNHVLVKIGDSIYFDLTDNYVLTEKPEIIGEFKDSNCTTPIRKGPTFSIVAKAWLKDVIAPFRDKIDYITFHGNYIGITLVNGDGMSFPDYDVFPKNFIIADGIDDYKYTLEELGL